MSLETGNFLRFRSRIDSADGRDVHRTFSGVYYPRWRALYLDEVKEVTGKVKLLTVLPFDAYTNQQGDYYYTADFVVGAPLWFDTKGYSPDSAPKKYVIIAVDDSNLRSKTENGLAPLENTRNLPADVFALLNRVRDAFNARCGELSLKALGRRFRSMDDSGNRLVSRTEFVKALKEVRLQFNEREVEQVFAAFDTNADGQLSYEELITVLRGPMSETRKQLVAQVFALLDSDRDGSISLKELLSKFSAKNHPEVVNGRLTEAQVISAFGSIWDTRDKNGLITFPEFCDYYNGVSASLVTDEEFIATVRSAWKL